MDQLEVVEICAGAGGQALGLHRAGFRHRVAVEWDRDAAATLAENFARLHDDPNASPVVVGDVTDRSVWAPERHSRVDLLAGGPPCPPFSDAGRRLGSADERDLYAFCIGLIGRVRPRAALLENVAGLSRARFAGYRQAVANRLTALGYRPEWRLIHATDHGVAQSRARFVLIAIESASAPYFQWPTGTPTSETVGTTLGSMMAANGWPGAHSWAANADDVAPTIVGGSRKHGGADLGPTGTRRRWAALGVRASSVADAAPSADDTVDAAPRLTPAMLARLQGFPHDWQFVGTKTSRCRQVGNAFPPPVAEALGRSVASALRHETQPSLLVPVEEHCPVTAALIRAGHDGVSERSLLSSGLGAGQVTRAVAHLERDFDVVVSRDQDGDTTYRMVGWRSAGGRHGGDVPLFERGRRAA